MFARHHGALDAINNAARELIEPVTSIGTLPKHTFFHVAPHMKVGEYSPAEVGTPLIGALSW